MREGVEGNEAAAVEAWIGRLARKGTLLLAVSGGSDSMALLCLFEEAVRARPDGGLKLHVATVDHRLRPGSGAEARRVASFCASRGLSHEILEWMDAKPDTGIQDAARNARYGLLRDAARRAGAVAVLTGHTLNDQRETVAMRAARADRGQGLSGMAEATLYSRDCWILRPLLGTTRAALRDCLRERGISWSDDPGNADPRFERVRVRQGAARGEEDDLAIAAAAAARYATANATALHIDRLARMAAPSLAVVDMGAGRPADDTALAALSAIAAALGGVAFPASAAQRQALADFIADPARRRRTLMRCVFEKRAGADGTGLIALHREARGLGLMTIGPGAGAVWDRRFHILNRDPCRPLHIRPRADGQGNDGDENVELPRRLLRAAAAGDPVLRFDGEAAEVPAGFPFQSRSSADSPPLIEVERVIARYDTFLPVFDLMLANALARLFGRQPYETPPIRLDPSP